MYLLVIYSVRVILFCDMFALDAMLCEVLYNYFIVCAFKFTKNLKILKILTPLHACNFLLWCK